MENKERIFKFTECKASDDCKDVYLPESNLEDKHINLYVGDLVLQYEKSPELSKERFKNWLGIK